MRKQDGGISHFAAHNLPGNETESVPKPPTPGWRHPGHQGTAGSGKRALAQQSAVNFQQNAVKTGS